MKYRFEYNGNPEYVTLHVTEQVAERFYHRTSSDATDSELMLAAAISGVPGVLEVSLDKYSVTCAHGLAFSHDDVLKGIVEVLKSFIGFGQVWEQLPTLRSDINMHQCPACMAEQNAMMREYMRDSDTREL